MKILGISAFYHDSAAAIIENGEIQIIDITGKVLQSIKFNNSISLKMENKFKSGIYFIQVYSNGILLETRKLIKL